MTYSCHRVFMNDVKSEYNTPQQSGHVMTAWCNCVQCGGRVTTECLHRARAAGHQSVSTLLSGHLTSRTLSSRPVRQYFTMCSSKHL